MTAHVSRQTGDRAVVLGASMAGLLASRVLADHYGHVTVVDRDELFDTGSHRRGVPHGRHLHALAARGQQALEELFPGLPTNWSPTAFAGSPVASCNIPELSMVT